MDELRARAEQPDLEGAVVFAGYVDDVWSAFARCDLVLAPSLGESLGNAVIQAQLARRPVVASDVQGHDQSIEDEVTGLLVPPADPAAMAAAVSRLLDDPALVRRLVDAAAQTAETRFSLSRYGQRISAVVSSLRRPQPAN